MANDGPLPCWESVVFLDPKFTCKATNSHRREKLQTGVSQSWLARHPSSLYILSSRCGLRSSPVGLGTATWLAQAADSYLRSSFQRFGQLFRKTAMLENGFMSQSRTSVCSREKAVLSSISYQQFEHPEPQSVGWEGESAALAHFVFVEQN